VRTCLVSPMPAHLSSWAGHNRSAKTNKANRYLKSALVEAAQAVGHHGQSYLKAQFARLATRRGKKRAAIAVAHSILVIAYHILRDGTLYYDLGADYFDQRKAATVQKQLVKRLERLGFQVDLQPLAPSV